MSKMETDPEFFSLNQLTISLLLLSMVLMKETIDQEIVQAICLACMLSLIIKEVDSHRENDRSPEFRADLAPTDSSEEYHTPDLDLADPPSRMEEDSPTENILDHHYVSESEDLSSLRPRLKTAPDMSARRPIEAFSTVPSRTGASHHQSITWKPMPPKSIVPTQHRSNKEFHSLSIRFLP